MELFCVCVPKLSMEPGISPGNCDWLPVEHWQPALAGHQELRQLCLPLPSQSPLGSIWGCFHPLRAAEEAGTWAGDAY